MSPELTRFAVHAGFSARQLRAAQSLPGMYNQIRGKRPDLYILIVNLRAAELDNQNNYQFQTN